MFGLICVNFDDFFTLGSLSQTRGHPLYKPRCTYAVRQNFFVDRVVFIWNALPLKVNFSSLSALKGALNNVDFSSYLK